MLDPLTIERMRACDRPVLVALSGGGDSVALLHLLVAEFGAAHLRASVVDHALRDGSAEDARRALGFAAALGVQGEVLTLHWPNGPKAAQLAAREARYAALCAYARTQRATVIATAHSADDQAETVFMRAGAGSSWRGLAGIAPFAAAPLWPEGRELYVARPLLGARREELRAYLCDRGADWIDDPANTNPRFERVRVRARLAALATAGLDPMRFVAMAGRLRAHVDALDRDAAALIARAATLDIGVSIVRAAWRGPALVRQRALAVLMAAAAGAAREAPLSQMADLELRVMGPDFQGSTHGGVLFQAHPKVVTLGRDPGAVLGRADGAQPAPALPLPANQTVIWDGRIALAARAPGWRAVPDRNTALLSLEQAGRRVPLDAAAGDVAWRSLTAERVRHAFAAAVNAPQPL